MAGNPPLQMPGNAQLLFYLRNANFNVTTDQALTPWYGIPPGLQYVLDRIIVTNVSTSLTTAAGGIYTAANKGGSAIVAAAQAYSGANAAGAGVDLTISAAGRGVLTATPIFSLTTGQGAAATGDILVFGYLMGNTGLY